MAFEVPFQIGRAKVALGQTRDLTLKISESYSGTPIHLPVRVVRGGKPGPALFVTGAIHGDELNGTGIVRGLIQNPPPLRAGTLVLVPVVNILGFERHSRYMPDRRDLNRSFPGMRQGSLTSRLAHEITREIIARCDYGIDLHSAATHRTNLPHVRADLTNESARRIATAFGCELIVQSPGQRATLRRTACESGCPTILLEAGEVWKIEQNVVDVGVRGVRNVLIELDMLDGEICRPDFQITADRTIWVRATGGGLLQFHVAPGDVVERGQPIAATTGLLNEDFRVINSTADGVVMGMTMLPACKPGDPICHIAVTTEAAGLVRSGSYRFSNCNLQRRVREDLAASIPVVSNLANHRARNDQPAA